MRAFSDSSLRRPGIALASTLIGVALIVAACSSTSTTTTNPLPIQRGTWIRPVFPSIDLPTLSVTGFADADQRVGYACAATLKQNDVTPTTTGTVTATATSTATAVPSATPTLTIPGRPPVPPSSQDIENSFWRTNNGGQQWLAANLPGVIPDLLCPISAIVAPDPASPADVFFLAAQGALNIANPTSLLPGQTTFQLWRSLNGGDTWSQLTIPTVPSPLADSAILSPYHLVITVDGDNLALGSNYSGANFLFTSIDGGQTWNQHTGDELDGGDGDTRTFAGFAAGANGSLLALATSTKLAATQAPFEVWQSADNATTWERITTPALSGFTGSTLQAQLFTAPGGTIAYLVVHGQDATNTTTTTSKTVALRSLDGGQIWTSLGWPSLNNVATGGASIAALGVGFAIDANGNAYIAPSNNDNPSDDNGPNSAGIFKAVTTDTAWKAATPALNASNTTIGLAVSMTPLEALDPPTPTPTGSVTTTATGSSTSTATATIAATSTSTATPTIRLGNTATPGTTTTPSTTATPGTPTSTATPVAGIPTLWTNFGPLALFASTPDNAGCYEYILP